MFYKVLTAVTCLLSISKLRMLQSLPSQFYGYQLEARKSPSKPVNYNRLKVIGIYYHFVQAKPVYGIFKFIFEISN